MGRGLEAASGLGEGALRRTSARQYDEWAVRTVRGVLARSVLLLAALCIPSTFGQQDQWCEPEN